MLRSQALPTEPDMPPLSRGKKGLHPRPLPRSSTFKGGGVDSVSPDTRLGAITSRLLYPGLT